MGAHERAQLRDLARAAHAHLHHHGLRLRICGQKRLGHAQLVVLVALRGDDGVRRGQHVAHEVLRRGLARRAGDADHTALEVPAPLARQVRDGVRRVGDLDDGRAQLAREREHFGGERLHDERAHGTRAQGRGHEVVAVDALARQRHVRVARLHLARVPGKARGQHARIHRLHRELAARARRYLLLVQAHASAPLPLAFPHRPRARRSRRGPPPHRFRRRARALRRRPRGRRS